MDYKYFSSICLRTPNFGFNENTFDSNEPQFSEAIYLASPDLYFEWQKENHGLLKQRNEIDKLKISLRKYYVRSSSRCTPFGLFAGLATTHFEIGNMSEIILDNSINYQRHTRLDMNYLCALSQDLANHELVKKHLNYYPNSSLFYIANSIRFVEYKYVNSRRVHHIVSVDRNDYLLKLIDIAKNGCSIQILAESIVDDDVSLSDALSFVYEIIDNQILISELSPNVTGDEFLPIIIKYLDKILDVEVAEICKVLQSVNSKLKIIDSASIGSTVNLYLDIIEELKTIGTKFEAKYLFQSDLIKPIKESKLDEQFIDELNQALCVLNRLSSIYKNQNIDKFKEAFYERYEESMIPLLLALDPDSGLGYVQNNSSGDVSPLIDNLFLPYRFEDEYDAKISKMTSLLFDKVKECVKNNKQQIEITDIDIESFVENWNNLPITFSVMIEHYGECYCLKSVGGTSAANLLGRFCHADNNTDILVREITKFEKEYFKDAIVAEIAHLPESRVGNILMRPNLRDYEIPYLSKSTLNLDQQIQLEDIFIAIRNNRIVLWSKKLDKEIIPRLSTAHNFSNNALPIYHFLCDLQGQDIRTGLGINWGFISREMNFLPRVIYKNAILSLAKWIIKIDEINKLIKADDESLMREILEFREKRNLPNYVLLAEGDNELFVNLDSLNHVKMLISVVKKRQSFELEEFLFDPDKAIVKSDEGVYTNQIVFSYYKNN